MSKNKLNIDVAQKSQGRMLVGTVISDKMEKTVVVKVARTFAHPLYGKVISRHKKYKVHDETKQAHVGDQVEIKECRPLSKDKHMILSRIITKA
jgi:small subunit ribosomal protein S17